MLGVRGRNLAGGKTVKMYNKCGMGGTDIMQQNTAWHRIELPELPLKATNGGGASSHG